VCMQKCVVKVYKHALHCIQTGTYIHKCVVNVYIFVHYIKVCTYVHKCVVKVHKHTLHHIQVCTWVCKCQVKVHKHTLQYIQVLSLVRHETLGPNTQLRIDYFIFSIVEVT
jgi:hypothetical protein